MSLWALHDVERRFNHRTPTLADSMSRDPSFGLEKRPSTTDSSRGRTATSPSRSALRTASYSTHVVDGRAVIRHTVKSPPRDRVEDRAEASVARPPPRPLSPSNKEDRRSSSGLPRATEQNLMSRVCRCQWNHTWAPTCPLHGSGARKAAANAGAGGRGAWGSSVEVDGENGEGATPPRVGRERESCVPGGTLEMGTSGDDYVRMSAAGFWRQKGDMTNDDRSVGFVPGDVSDGAERQQHARPTPQTQADRPSNWSQKYDRMSAVIEASKERAMASAAVVGRLQSELQSVSSTLRSTSVEAAAARKLSPYERELAARDREAREKVASDIVDERWPREGGRKDRVEASKPEKGLAGGRGGLYPGQEELPTHVRPSYEAEIDKISHAFRVARNVERENRQPTKAFGGGLGGRGGW